MHLVCHFGSPSCLVQRVDIPSPNPNLALHRQKRCRLSGFPRDFPRRRHTALQRGLFWSQASCCSKHCFRFCNRSIHWWVISPVSFAMVNVSQHVSGYIQAGLHGYCSGLGSLTPHHTSPCPAIPYFACFHLLRRGCGFWIYRRYFVA